MSFTKTIREKDGKEVIIYFCNKCGQGFPKPNKKHIVSIDPKKYCRG